MKGLKKHFIIFLFALSAVFAFTACENSASNENGSAVADAENSGQSWLSPGKFGSTDNTISNKSTTTTGESTEQQNADEMWNTENDTNENVENDTTDTGENTDTDAENESNDAENGVEDVVDDAENIVDDIADGIGDAINNLGGGSFDRYDDAKEYLLTKLQKDNAAAHYELREETEDLTAYNSNDSGAEGYKFSVYETDGNEKIGIYYVDKDTGKIYRYMGKSSIEAY